MGITEKLVEKRNDFYARDDHNTVKKSLQAALSPPNIKSASAYTKRWASITKLEKLNIEVIHNLLEVATA